MICADQLAQFGVRLLRAPDQDVEGVLGGDARKIVIRMPLACSICGPVGGEVGDHGLDGVVAADAR